jgi:hypothetical protein
MACYPFYQYLGVTFEGMHIWRQADCLSLSKTYSIFDNSFFEPRLFNLGFSGNGKTGSDFPLFYYLYSFFAETPFFESAFKLCNLSIAIGGLLALFNVMKTHINHISAFVISLMFLTSSTYVFYAGNYLMNVPSLSLTFISVFLFSLYFRTKKTHWFIAGILVSIISILIKPTALSHYIVLTFIIVLKSWIDLSYIRYSKLSLGILIVVILIMLAWVFYIKMYNNHNNSGMFLTGILPIWSMSKTEILNVILEFKRRFGLFYNPYVLCVIPIAFLISSINLILKRKIILVHVAYIIYCLGFIAFFILFYQVLDQHDYYLINWLVLVPFGLVILYSIVPVSGFNYNIFNTVLIIVLIDSIFFCNLRMTDRYSGWRNELYTSYIMLMEEDYNNEFQSHLSFQDPIYIPSDKSINISLYTLNTVGWTGYNKLSASNLLMLKSQNLKYILLKKNETKPNFLVKNSTEFNVLKKGTHFDLYIIKLK